MLCCVRLTDIQRYKLLPHAVFINDMNKIHRNLNYNLVHKFNDVAAWYQQTDLATVDTPKVNIATNLDVERCFTYGVIGAFCMQQAY